MGKRHRNKGSPDEIPNKPTAVITDTMRADAAREGPEEFENVDPKPSAPVEKAPPAPAMPQPQTPARPMDIRFSATDEIRDYDKERIEIWSQSSGTLSYGSEISGLTLSAEPVGSDSEKAQREITMKRRSTTAVILNRDENARAVVITRKDLIQHMTSADAPKHGCFEARKRYNARPGVIEQRLAKKVVNDALTDYFTYGRDDVSVHLSVSRRGVYPIVDIRLVPRYASRRIPSQRNNYHMPSSSSTPYTCGQEADHPPADASGSSASRSFVDSVGDIISNFMTTLKDTIGCGSRRNR
ncbi:hypothetical protein AAVH_03327 [Aphelenchoides avenae]|nr:hypothetical protein AAVH_03327 [Aphelenchus avenae]